MDFSAFFEANEYDGRKARYYKSLGYSEQAAAVLAVLTYGSAPLSRKNSCLKVFTICLPNPRQLR